MAGYYVRSVDSLIGELIHAEGQAVHVEAAGEYPALSRALSYQLTREKEVVSVGYDSEGKPQTFVLRDLE